MGKSEQKVGQDLICKNRLVVWDVRTSVRIADTMSYLRQRAGEVTDGKRGRAELAEMGRTR